MCILNTRMTAVTQGRKSCLQCWHPTETIKCEFRHVEQIALSITRNAGAYIYEELQWNDEYFACIKNCYVPHWIMWFELIKQISQINSMYCWNKSHLGYNRATEMANRHRWVRGSLRERTRGEITRLRSTAEHFCCYSKQCIRSMHFGSQEAREIVFSGEK